MKVNQDTIHQSTKADHIYIVRSTANADREYEVNIAKWTCTCTVGRTGIPSGEPCRHQHSVAKKLNLMAPNLLPYFNSEGRYLHALIALGQDKVGEKSFYVGMKEAIPPPTSQGSIPTARIPIDDTIDDNNLDSCMECDEGSENLDLMLSIMEEQEKLKEDVITLGNAFMEDIQERVQQMNTPYLSGLKKFFTIYMDTVTDTEPAVSATPKLTSLLHTYFSRSSPTQVAGTRNIHVQPTAIARRREGIAKEVNWHQVADLPNVLSL